MKRFFCSPCAAVLLVLFSATATAATRPNLLLITVDDMNADSVGVFGSTTPGTTPNIDQLAAQGLRFHSAHVQVANCTPSRNVMWSGRYPHSNKVEGFYQVRDSGYDTLSDLLQKAGYFTAIRHKVNGSTPFFPYDWNLVLDYSPDGKRRDPKDPDSYGLSTTEGIKAARSAGKPFALLMNIADPHVPFYGLNRSYEIAEDAFAPSRIYRAEEISIPGFLVDDPVIRRELSHYYTSVRRADDAVGEIMHALKESGEADNTLVMFLSDHGMPFPFAKTQLYHHSTWTPLIFRWPGVIEKGSVDEQHMVSAVDILPTLLNAIDAPVPAGIEGLSFLPLLRGEDQDNRDWVIKEYNENSQGDRTPMRAVQGARFLYIFNPWSNGSRAMSSATLQTGTYSRMLELAKDDEALAARLDLLKYRVVEEFYDIKDDPDCLVNLIDDPLYKKDIEKFRAILQEWMRETHDHALDAFLNRTDPKALASYMSEQELSTSKRRKWIRAIRDSLKQDQAGDPQEAEI
jgi:N-sulfoglucosamine sulfohydrolase